MYGDQVAGYFCEVAQESTSTSPACLEEFGSCTPESDQCCTGLACLPYMYGDQVAGYFCEVAQESTSTLPKSTTQIITTVSTCLQENDDCISSSDCCNGLICEQSKCINVGISCVDTPDFIVITNQNFEERCADFFMYDCSKLAELYPDYYSTELQNLIVANCCASCTQYFGENYRCERDNQCLPDLQCVENSYGYFVCGTVKETTTTTSTIASTPCTEHNGCAVGNFCHMGFVCRPCEECHHCRDGVGHNCGECDPKFETSCLSDNCMEIDGTCLSLYDCCDDLICADQVCTTKLCIEKGNRCEAGDQCCSNLYCNLEDGICEPEAATSLDPRKTSIEPLCATRGLACNDSNPCCDRLICTEGVCAWNSTSMLPTSTPSFYPTSTHAGCFRDGASCEASSDCCVGLVCHYGYCFVSHDDDMRIGDICFSDCNELYYHRNCPGGEFCPVHGYHGHTRCTHPYRCHPIGIPTCSATYQCPVGEYCTVQNNTCVKDRFCCEGFPPVEDFCPTNCQISTSCLSHEDCSLNQYCASDGFCKDEENCCYFSDSIDRLCTIDCHMSCNFHSDCFHDEFCHVSLGCQSCHHCSNTSNGVNGTCGICPEVTTMRPCGLKEELCSHNLDCCGDLVCDYLYNNVKACVSLPNALDSLNLSRPLGPGDICLMDCSASGIVVWNLDRHEECGNYDSHLACVQPELGKSSCEFPYKCIWLDINECRSTNFECPEGEYCTVHKYCERAIECCIRHNSIEGKCPIDCDDPSIYHECDFHANCTEKQYCTRDHECFEEELCVSHRDSIDGVCPTTGYQRCSSHENCEGDAFCSKNRRQCFPCAECFVCEDGMNDHCANCTCRHQQSGCIEEAGACDHLLGEGECCGDLKCLKGFHLSGHDSFCFNETLYVYYTTIPPSQHPTQKPSVPGLHSDLDSESAANEENTKDSSMIIVVVGVALAIVFLAVLITMVYCFYMKDKDTEAGVGGAEMTERETPKSDGNEKNSQVFSAIYANVDTLRTPGSIYTPIYSDLPKRAPENVNDGEEELT